jgi:uncharacterized damage-inducible protein DinB
MYRTIADFMNDRNGESATTLRVLNAVNPTVLEQRAFDHGRSIRELAWHITTSLVGIVGQAGLKIEGASFADPMPEDFREIIETYEKSSRALVDGVQKEWNDAKLSDDLIMWGMPFTYGGTLGGLVRHEVHHRAQLMTLLRMAGQKVPGVYGPTYEDMAARQVAEPAEA